MNIFKAIPSPDGEITEILYETENTRIERIVSCGQSSPDGFWYDQNEDEWLTLLEGQAILRFEDKTLTLSRGDCLLIKAHEKHRVDFTSKGPPCIWLCVFSK